MPTSTTYDHQIVLRASGALVRAVADRANASGVSVSEYLRGLIRDRVGLN